MARRSILSTVRTISPAAEQPPEVAPETPPKPAAAVKPSRRSKLHIGGYYEPHEPAIIAFQKLGIDMRKTQQEMLLEAICDFVSKHEAAVAFR